VRALLVFNPNATTTDDDVRDVIASALASAIDLTVVPTKQRGHATHLVAGAVHEGVEVVCVLGGDGTANEVIQALAGTDVRLGIIPGGGTNVLARALGLPNDAVHATKIVLDRLRAGQDRCIALGRAGERYFGFNAGFGFDAAVVRHVEQHAGALDVARLDRELQLGEVVAELAEAQGEVEHRDLEGSREQEVDRGEQVVEEDGQQHRRQHGDQPGDQAVEAFAAVERLLEPARPGREELVHALAVVERPPLLEQQRRDDRDDAHGGILVS
jgi:hypothetical protein